MKKVLQMFLFSSPALNQTAQKLKKAKQLEKFGLSNIHPKYGTWEWKLLLQLTFLALGPHISYIIFLQILSKSHEQF
jgi:hypothetical protein